MTKIETERLILREMTPGDFDRLYAVLADSNIMQHYPHTFDETRVRNWINKNLERYRVFGFSLWAVCLKENGGMIGDCGLTMQNINGTILPEIGYHKGVPAPGLRQRGRPSRPGLDVPQYAVYDGVLLHAEGKCPLVGDCPGGMAEIGK